MYSGLIILAAFQKMDNIKQTTNKTACETFALQNYTAGGVQ